MATKPSDGVQPVSPKDQVRQAMGAVESAMDELRAAMTVWRMMERTHSKGRTT